MADDTKLIIQIETILRGLERTLRGLAQVERQLKSVASIKVSKQSTTSTDKATQSAQRLEGQQKKLVVQAQELANRQEKARQTTERLAASQERLVQSSRKSAAVDAQNLKSFQRRIDGANAAEKKRTSTIEQEVKRRQRTEKAAEQENLRNFQRRTRILDREEQGRVRAERATTARPPQFDAHVQDFKRLEAAAKAANARILGLGNAARSIGQGLTSLGVALTTAVTAPLIAFGLASTRTAITLDSLRRGLEAIAGSAVEARIQMARLTEIAKLPGIGFEEAIQGSIRLQAVGFSAREAERALIQFSNAVALTGGGREELSRITVQLGQLAAKGKVLSQDLRPIIEAAPAVGRALKQAFGTVNADDLADMTESSREFLDILIKELERLPRAAAGAKNAFENFRDTVFRAAATVGEALLPALTQLVEIAGPIITTLANAFRALPVPLQSTVIFMGLLVAAIGPLSFIFGQLITGLGRAVVGFAQLNALGILPTIANFRLLGSVMIGTASLAQGAAATAAAAATGWGLLAIAIAGVVASVAAIAFLSKAQEKLAETTESQIAATALSLKALRGQEKVLAGVANESRKTAKSQTQLEDIYNTLNKSSQVRVLLMEKEIGLTQALRQEVGRLIAVRLEEQRLQAAASAAQLVQTTQEIKEAGTQIDRVIDRVKLLQAARESLTKTGFLTKEQRESVELLSIAASDSGRQLEVVEKRIKELTDSLPELRKRATELDTTWKSQSDTLRALEESTGQTTRQILEQAKALGLFKGDVDEAVKGIEAFRSAQLEAEDATDALTRALRDQSKELLAAGKRADDLAKKRKDRIGAASSLAREATDDFQGALKTMRAFIAAQPELARDIEKERQLAGKTLQEFLEDVLGGGRKRDRLGTSLRNAQEQLAKSLADVSQASAEQQAVIEKAKNEQLLQENESAFKLQLVAYRQYLNERARLNSLNLQLEIDEQRKVADDAIAERDRFLARGAGKLPPAEAIKVKAGAAEADEKRIVAETKILELQGRQRLITDELKQSLADAQKQQLEDVRKLEIEYGELTGRIEDALNTATDERFREVLTGLARSQDDLNKRIEFATHNRELETVAELEAARAQNQRQVEAINNIIDQERALNRLKAAEEFVNRARERQAELEQQIAFDVEFRGLKETEAIRRRLEGEEKVRNSLLIARDIIQESIDRLEQLGVKAPQGLIDFVRQTEAAVKGLGELPFIEQFRLAEQEFQRLNDERIRKIQDVERAVRHRDLAEIEGRILIKKLNGEYVGDLERQAELLRQIAERSGQEGLKRQAADAGALALDVRAATTEVADFATALRSVSIDSLQEGLANFFTDLTDRTKTAQEKLLSLLDNVAARINAFIAENLAQELIESIFGDSTQQGQAGSGIIASIKRLFGLGGDQGGGAITGAAGGLQGGAALTGGATAAATALTTGGAAAATALTTGGITAATTLAASIAAAAAGFSAAVIAAGAAFAAAVSASSAASSFAGFAGAFAAGDVVPAVPRGKIIRVAEGGYDEAVLTTDPKHAVRQLKILRQYLRQTRGLFGRIPEYAAGDMISARDAEIGLLSSIQRSPLSMAGVPEVAIAGGSGEGFKFRFNFIDDQRDINNWMNSPEGEQVITEKLIRNRTLIKRLAGGRN